MTYKEAADTLDNYRVILSDGRRGTNPRKEEVKYNSALNFAIGVLRTLEIAKDINAKFIPTSDTSEA